MNFRQCIETRSAILMEGALGERLKREYGLTFDAHIAMANLIYEKRGAAALTALWKEYMDIARRYQLPFLATTPTRRANHERILKSNASETLFADNVNFLKRLQKEGDIEMYVGGLLGCKGDAYTGEGSLSADDAEEFHRWTVEHFWDAGVDFLYAGIMPALQEAMGLARAIDDTGLPYIISFTIQQDGRLIDGTVIADAIEAIDAAVANKPVCYMTNCVHPRIVFQALSNPLNDNALVKQRFCGIQANTSPLPYAMLDNSPDLHCTQPEEFAKEMLQLSKIGGFKIWGGCCGTDNRHMECVAKRLDLSNRVVV